MNLDNGRPVVEWRRERITSGKCCVLSCTPPDVVLSGGHGQLRAGEKYAAGRKCTHADVLAVTEARGRSLGC